MQKIEYIAIEKLRVHPNNPRTIKGNQFKVLCDSVKNNKDYFEARPILCNKELVIFAGTMRFLAAGETGMKEVPVCIMDISEERQKELMLRDNWQNGEWNFDELVNWDEKLLLDVGFESEALDKIFNVAIEDDDFDLEAAVKKITETTVREGDLFEINGHRILCGDSTNPKSLEKLFYGK